MGEKPDQITEELEQRRAVLASNLNALDQKVKNMADWRLQFEKHPVPFLGAAFGGGLVASLLIFGRRQAPDGRSRRAEYCDWPRSRRAATTRCP